MIKLNRKDLSDLFVEDTEISKVMYGDKTVWEGIKVVTLGQGKQFDIKTLYPNFYNELTADNFFALSADTATGATMVDMRETGATEVSGFKARLVKSYNAETGLLTFYNACCEHDNRVLGSANVNAVMVRKTDKLIYLGNGRSFDVASYPGYGDFTADNFLIQSSDNPGFGNTYRAQGYHYRDYGSGQSIISKTYDKNTGTLSCYIRQYSWDTGGVYTYYNANNYGGLKIYLNPKVQS